MSGLVPETSFVYGASGPENIYNTTPTGLGLSPSYLASNSANASANASGGGSGSEISYSQIVTTVAVTDTTEATATAIITTGTLTFDGQDVFVEFFSPVVTTPNLAPGSFVFINLFEGSTQIARLAEVADPSGGTSSQEATPVFGRFRFTPSAGPHTYKVTAYTNSTSGAPSIGAGAGGTSALVPAYVRFVRA